MMNAIREQVHASRLVSQIYWICYEWRVLFTPKQAIPFRAKAVVTMDRVLNNEHHRLAQSERAK